MEGLAAASAVFAVVSLAGQVAQGCTYLRGIFENARSAPKELQLLTTELMIIERIINGTPDIDQHEDELDFCNERLLKLRKLVDKYGELEGAGRGRKWGKRLAMAFGSDKLEKYLASLRQAKEYLERIQYLSAHNLSLVKSNEVFESVQQLTTSHSEAARIISRTEGKLDDLGGITRQTQAALYELAERFVQRDNISASRNEQNLGRIVSAIEEMLQEKLQEHLSQLGSVTRKPMDHLSNIKLNSKRNRYERKEIAPLNHTMIHGRQSHALSEVDQRILELHNLSKIAGTTQTELKELSQVKKTSKYQTRVGEVIMRTVSTTYSTLSEMQGGEHLSVVDYFGLMNTEHFPATITVTEILLLPRSWKEARGATITCKHVAGPASTLSDVCFELRDFRNPHASFKPPDRNPEPLHQANSTRFTDGLRLSRQKSSSSSLVLYTAFKTAFLATYLERKKQNPHLQQLAVSKPIPRNSFDREINDVLELVHLWIQSGLDAEFYRQAFPKDMAETKKRCETIFQASSPKTRGFQRLRLEYTFQLITNMVAQSGTGQLHDPIDLNTIHDQFWDRAELMATSDSISAQVLVGQIPEHLIRSVDRYLLYLNCLGFVAPRAVDACIIPTNILRSFHNLIFI